MPVIDCNKHKIETNSNIYDICIIGTGLANYPILVELLSLNINKKIALIEFGSLKSIKKYEYEYKSDFIRNDFNQLFTGFGGNSQKWANRLMIDQNGDNYFKELWRNKKNLSKVTNLFGLKSKDFSIKNISYNENFNLNKAIWPKKILRIQKNKNFINKIIKNVDLYLNFKAKYFSIIKNNFDEIFSTQNHKIKSKIFILGCGGLENSKILLRTKAYNISHLDKNNLIGKFLSDHPKRKLFSLKNFRENLNFFLPKYKFNYKYQYGLNLNNQILANEKISKLNFNINYKLETAYEKTFNKIKLDFKSKKNLLKFENYKFLFNNIYYHVPKENFIYYYYYLYFLFKKKNNNIKYFVDIFTEQPMLENNQIKLLSKNDDKFEVRNFLNNSLENSIDKSSFYFQKFLRANQIEYCETDNILEDASHILCTTRSSDKAEEGVVDANCKLYGFDNIFITGSSCFPKVSYFNPTLLIMLQSLKTLDYILSNENSI